MATSNNGNKQSWKPDIVVTNIKNLDERIFMSNLQNIIESKPEFRLLLYTFSDIFYTFLDIRHT